LVLRLVQVFDHFCPWIGNSVGKGNRHIFIAFVCVMSIAIVLGYIVTFGRMSQVGLFTWGPHSPRPRVKLTAGVMWTIMWPIYNVPLLLSLLGLAGSQLAQARLHSTCDSF
jgi:palmitoyltransferase ZDHHC13/17